MRRSVMAAALVGAVQDAAATSSEGHGYKSSKEWLPRIQIPGAVAADLLVSEASLPSAFDWRDVGGTSYATADWNQHIPQYCGGCWIHGTLSALNDRIKVMRGARFPDVMLGRQAITNCVPDPTSKGPPPGCNGGDSWMIHRYMHENKVPDETCLPYQARNMECVAENVCRNCFPGDKGCFTVKNWIGYGVSTYGNVSGEAAMMKEIYARGPIACSFATDDAFMMNYSSNVEQHEGVYVTDQIYNESQIDHVMEIAGWGETPGGIKYWVIRNSWGTYWGHNGWAKIRRGVNQMQSESSCDWAVPDARDLDNALEGHVMGDYVRGIQAVTVNAPALAEPQFVFTADALTPMAEQLTGNSKVQLTSDMGLVLACTFVSGIAAALVAVRLAKPSSLQQRPLLG